MQRDPHEFAGFRRRLLQLIAEKCDGKYTVLARRAGIAVSTLEHYIHQAKGLPGGAHLLRLAAVLGVSAEYLGTGRESGRALEPGPQAPPSSLPPGGGPGSTHLAVPLFECGCPGPCALAAGIPPAAAARSRVMVEAELVQPHLPHRFIALKLSPTMHFPQWPDDTRLIVDCDAAAPQWDTLSLVRLDGCCQLGHLVRSKDMQIFAARLSSKARLLPRSSRFLGRVVAAIIAF